MAHTKSRHKLERERRKALDEIERIERPKRLKSEREAKLTKGTNVRFRGKADIPFCAANVRL